ncbi:MAG: efflux RND transporter permease subunit [Melioribacteraceae bacterium]|nr:efflux RND transporter permease subunit [Melioribacteraceae bacterium]
MTLTELSIKRPSLIIVIFAAFIILGLFSFQKLKYELLPKFSPAVITITTIYPGASPNEVETGVSKPLEDAVSGLDKVSEIKSTSMEGVSFVTIELLQSAKVDLSLQDAQRKVNEIFSSLPDGVKSPVVSKIALDEIPVIRLGVSGSLSDKELFQFVKDKVKPELSKVAGVGQIALIGGNEREIKVNLDMEKLKAYGLSIMQVTQTIKNSNLDFPTGKIKDSDEQYIVRIAGKFSSLEQVRNLAIGTSKTGGEIKLSDVAEVEDGTKDVTNISRIDGKSTIAINVLKQTDANAVDVSKLVKLKLAELEATFADYGFKYTISQDGSIFTVDAANAVKTDLLIAVFLVALVMLLFLHSIRNSVIVLVAIPSSLITTFMVMWALDFTLNLMTLLALSLVVGILVDDSIVVLENIYHHLEKGEEKRTAALRGRNEIGFAALAITLVDVSVFFPLSLTSGIIGNIMRQFSIVVVVSTLLSLFVSFTITPMLASRFAKVERLTNRTLLGKFAIWFEAKFKTFTEFYITLLNWSFKNKGKVFIGTVVIFFASVALVPLGFIGGEFMAVADRGEFAVTVKLPPGTKIEETNRISQEVENMILKTPGVERVFVNAGASSEGLIGFASNNSSEINVTLVPKNEREKSTDEIGQEIKEKAMRIPGVEARYNPIGIFGVANQTPIQLLVNGTNVDSVYEAAAKIEKELTKVPGTTDVRLSSEQGKPETKIDIDRQKLNAFGLSLAEVGGALRVALTGDDESKFREGNTEYSLRIQLDEFNRSSTEDLGSLSFTNKKGQQIYLKQFADISRTTGPSNLQRQNRNAAVTVFSQVIGRPTGTISTEFTEKMKNVRLPNETTYSFGGDVKNQKEAFGDLGIAMMAAVLFSYLVMVGLYDSFVYPFVVLFSIPLAIVGGLLALALTMKSLNVFTILGMIMLVGLVGKNAILLVDRTNYMRGLGESVKDSLIDAARMRVRPIFMTTLTMIFGMMPIALSTSSGSEWKTGLAWVLIGGLTSSLFLTLIVVPVVYTKVEEYRERIPKLFGKVSGLLKKKSLGLATE